ncbi:helix-turn-helix transcriptional regulator [Streptomyces odontomachi]|uniref:helix-turn-helix transcriptional regulator n=1 Tax=Streptomyces odontomachi TaxID=2944940 RepID=UPI00210CA2C3|nr:helix-turn-helix transcriptional regulator [Streptomyces sp. ODS25]
MLSAVQTRSVSPVFVGRADELGVLKAALARATGTAGSATPRARGTAPDTAAQQPQAETLLLGGEAGVGKTRLVEEFAALARAEGGVVAIGGCVEIGADGLPFAPFSAVLRALRRQLPDEMAAAAAGQEAELARLLPELGEAQPRSGSLHDEEAMARLFELTARLLERMAGEHTLVVVLEDLQWADASTRHLLAYLLRTLRGPRLVILATYRSDDIHRRHPLRPLLAELDRLRTVHRLELRRFSHAEVGCQLAGILAHTPDPALLDDIFERSDGNAFFVEELACAAHEGRAAGLTDTLRDLLLVRVERLPEDAQRVVRIAAEGGSTVEHALLAAVAGLGEDELIEALRAAVGASILIASSDGDGYRFRHSLVREAVRDDLLPGERSRLNRRYAASLEADPALVSADTCVPRIASYWYHAHDAAKALPAVLRASVVARRRHAYSEQLCLLERAMELWDAAGEPVRAGLRPVDYTEAYLPCGDPDSTPLSFLDLMAEAAVAGRLCGERDRALTITRRALHLLENETAGRDPLRAAWFWVQRSRLVQGLARGDGWQELGTAQDLVRGLPPSEVHAEVLAGVAGWSMTHEPGPESLAAAERAVEYARMLGARDIEMDARTTLGGLMVDAGQVEAGLAEMQEVTDRVRELGSPAGIGRSYVNLPSALEGVGRSREAVDVLEEGIRLSRHYGLLDSQAWMWGNLAESLYALGRWDEAAEAAAQAERGGQHSKPRGAGAARLACLALARGDLAEAARRLTEARRHYGTHDPRPEQSLPLARIALELAAGEGRLLDARTELARAIEVGFPPGTQRYGWPLLLAAATAEADARTVPVAGPGRADAVDRIRTAAKRLTTCVPVWAAHASWVRAELLRAEGRAAPDEWLDVVAAFGPLERPYDLARVRHRLAQALLASGAGTPRGCRGPGEGDDDRDRAAELLRQAGAVARHLGARPLAEAVATLAQRGRLALTRGAAPDPADPAEALGLTSRERDVLRLVAAGRSNRQIAEELFISPKTASVHVSNILAKLGVSGRGEAAALAHERGLFAADEAVAHSGGPRR